MFSVTEKLTRGVLEFLD